MFFKMFFTFFTMCNRGINSADKLMETVEDRASAFNLEQREENKQRLAYIKAKQAHTEANPEKFEF